MGLGGWEQVGDGGTEVGFSCGNGVKSGFEFVGQIFQQITGYTSADGFLNVAGMSVEREDNDANFRKTFANVGGSGQAIHAGHGDVHENDVGVMTFDFAEDFLAVGGFGEEFNMREQPEQRPNSGAHRRMVFGNYDTYSHGRSLVSEEAYTKTAGENAFTYLKWDVMEIG